MATRYSLAEQVMLRISRGYAKGNSPVQMPDLIMAIGQKCNQYLKVTYFNSTLGSGETIPDGLMLGTYPPVTVYPNGKRSFCTLPVMPIMLPRNLGVTEVSPFADFSLLYIPLQNGQTFLLQGQPLISDLLGQIGYEVVGNQLVFTKDITVIGVSKIYLKLAILDISKLSDYDVLPLGADLETLIIEDLYKQFAPIQSNSDKIDNYETEPKTNGQ